MGNQPLAGDAPVVIPSENELWRLERVDDDVPTCLFTLLKKGIEEERCREGLKVGVSLFFRALPTNIASL